MADLSILSVPVPHLEITCKFLPLSSIFFVIFSVPEMIPISMIYKIYNSFSFNFLPNLLNLFNFPLKFI